MAFQDTLAELEQYDLSPEEYRKVQRIKELAQQRGLMLNPSATENPKNQAISQAPPAAKTFADSTTEFLTQDVPEIGAATAGGMAAARRVAALPLPGMLRPIATGLAGIAGATGGLMSLRGGKQIAHQGGPLTLDQLLNEAGRSGMEAATGEAIGSVPRLLGKGYKLGKQALLSGRAAQPEELQTFEQAQGMGVHLRPADVTLSPSALRTEQTLRGTQAGADVFRKRDLLNQENFERAYSTQLADTVATRITPQERGQLLKDVIEGRAIPEYQEMSRRAFDELRQITEGEKVVRPKESFALAQELLNSVTAETNPKTAGIIKKVVEQLGQPGIVTGVKVSKSTGTLPGTPGTEYLSGLKVRSTSAIEQAPLTTGLTVKGKYGKVSDEAQAIEDLGGNPAEPPLLGLKILRKSDADQSPLVTGLKVAPEYQKTPDIPGKDVLAHMNVETTSRAPMTARPMDFMEAHDVRSMLGELGATGETLPKKASGIANKLWQILGLEMEQGAIGYQQKTGIPLSRKWRQADDFVKMEGHALFDDNVIAKLIKANPEDVVRETLKPNGLTEVQRVTQALSRIKDEPGLEQYRRGVLEHLWEQGVVKSGTKRGEFSGAQFADAAHKLGPDVLKEALGPVHQRFQKFLEVASHMDPKSASGTGMSLIDKGVLITAPLAGVGGAIMQQSAYPLVSAASAVGTWMISTKHFAEILNDPKRAGALLRVIRTSPFTEAWTRAVGQMIGIEGGERILPRPIQSATLQPAPR